jgi:hypothetical protein
MSKIVVHIDGGVIQWVTEMVDASTPSNCVTGIIIVDTDVEGCSIDDNVTAITDSNDQEVMAYVHEETIYPHDKSTDIGHFVETYFDNNEIDALVEKEQLDQLPLLLATIRTKEGRDRIGRILKGED